jgi:hypothetical protein
LGDPPIPGLDPTDTASFRDIGDPFAGCFLSLAGSLVGVVIGSVVLAVRMLPGLSPGGLILGLVAGFIAGVVVGLITTWPIAALGIRVGRGAGRVSLAENIWLSGTALAAGVGAALTPSLVISVDGGG